MLAHRAIQYSFNALFPLSCGPAKCQCCVTTVTAFVYSKLHTGCPRKIDTIKIGRFYSRGRTKAKKVNDKKEG